GWDDSGRRLWLLVVDGRSLRSAGLTIAATARLLQSHGVRNAVMLDGGGSAEMLARTSPHQDLRIVNNPSEGEERPVPNGLAVLTSQALPNDRKH
ncbi:phosphodiester glycosidase family protein, partial [Streptomyces sp. NPDC059956]